MPKQPLMLGKIQIKAVVLGFLTDVVLTTILVAVFTVLMVIVTAAGGGGTPDLDTLSRLPVFELGAVVIGTMGTIIGGFVTGRLAKSEEIAHGLVMGLISLLFGFVVVTAFPEESYSEKWMEVVAFVLTIPAAVLGGWMARNRPKAV